MRFAEGSAQESSTLSSMTVSQHDWSIRNFNVDFIGWADYGFSN